MYKAGELNWQNGTQLFSGLAGGLGNVMDAKALGRTVNSLDELADGGKIADDIVEGAADVGKKVDGCFYPGTLVHQLVPPEERSENQIDAVLTPVSQTNDENNPAIWLVTIVISAAAGTTALKRRRKKKPHGGPIPQIS